MTTQAPADATPQDLGATANEVVVRTEAQLRAAIKAEKPILLVETVILTSPLPNITTSVTIRGHATTCADLKFKLCRIDGRSKYRHFTVTRGGRLQLTLVMLSRGYTRDGSGGSTLLVNGGVAILNRVFFRGNSAFGTAAGGGAIEVDEGSKLYSTASHFIRNIAGFGGAIGAADGSTLSLYGNIFHRNLASTAGGAISMLLHTQATIRKSQFTANEAGQGAIIHLDASNMTLCNATYWNNNATLMAPDVLAQTGSTVVLCAVPRTAVVATDNSTVTQSCTACI
ncbi:unnamed protein product [Closterium sp. Yama58-4]|nr:unnamed protein product [Closterium sp. Yama58-4]